MSHPICTSRKLLSACLLPGMLAAAAFSAPASAGPIEVDTSGSAVITQRPVGGGLPISFTGSSIDVNLADPNGVGAGVSAIATVNGGSVQFGSSAISAGGFAHAISTSSVDITLTNPYETAILPNLSSVVTPASIGFMIADPLQCGGADLYACVEAAGSFQNLTPDPQQPHANALAWSSFTFNVSSEGQQIYSLTASISLVMNASGVVSVVTDTDDAAAVLANFSLLTPAGSQSAYVLSWDATPLDLPFPDYVTKLEPGDSRTLTYSVTSESWTRANGGAVGDRGFLVAFAGIGDPCCQGGASAKFNNTPFNFAVPELQGETVVFTPAAGGIPEPSTWAMLIAGFGTLGIATRRRRTALPQA